MPYPTGAELYYAKARNVTLPGAEMYTTFELLPTRFLRHGWDMAEALTLKDIRREYVNSAERERFVLPTGSSCVSFVCCVVD